jgi:hypothetical protein
MALTLLVVVLALLLAVVAPSRPGSRPALRSAGLLVAAALLLLAEPLLTDHIAIAYPVLIAAAAVVLARFAALNRAIPGVVLACLGLCLNAGVVLANGSMPVEERAVIRAGIDPASLALDDDPRHELADDSTVLRALDDRVAVPIPGAREVNSLGDVAIAAGLGLFTFALARRHRRDLDPEYVMMSGWARPRSPERC